MPNFNFEVFLNSYADAISTNSPSMNNFKWDRNVNGLSVNNPTSLTAQIAASGSQTLFTGGNTKRMVYLEVDQICTVTINGSITFTVKPLVQGTNVYPGVLMLVSDITSLSVTNTSGTTAANVFMAAIE